MTVLPSFSICSMSHITRRLSGSRPAVGSSKIRTRGFPIRAMATQSFRFIPPLKALLLASILLSRSQRLITSRTSLSVISTAFKSANNCTCSRTVNLSHKTLCCGQIPTSSRTAVMSWAMLFPRTKASPPLGSTPPVNICIVVVFPAPLCPKRAVISPRYISTVSPSTALTSVPYTFRRPSMAIPTSFVMVPSLHSIIGVPTLTACAAGMRDSPKSPDALNFCNCTPLSLLRLRCFASMQQKQQGTRFVPFPPMVIMQYNARARYTTVCAINTNMHSPAFGVSWAALRFPNVNCGRPRPLS